MAITGALGFRTLEFSGGKFISPSRRDFPWLSPIVWASCKSCPLDLDGHIIPQLACTCGIHATLWRDEFQDYMFNKGAVGVIVEALGDYWIHDFGFTASGAQVIGVVSLFKFAKELKLIDKGDEVIRNLEPQHLVALRASEFFRVNLMTYETARTAMKMMWEKLGERWPNIPW